MPLKWKINISVKIKRFGVVLTSSEARQYQQKTCLHLLHNIWAHPSSFSIGTLHIGQHLINSESNVTPGTTSSDLQGDPACQEVRQLEQKSILHVGQCTLWGVHRSVEHKVQTVSQPARGHHVRLLSISTSVNRTIKKVTIKMSNIN